MITLEEQVLSATKNPFENMSIPSSHLGRLQIERRLHLQYAITQLLAKEYTLADSGPAILQTLSIIGGWQGGEIWKLDGARKMLLNISHWISPNQPVDISALMKRQSASFGEGIPGKVWAQGKPRWTTDISRDLNIHDRGIFQAKKLNGTLGIPIRTNNILTGVLLLFSSSNQKPDADFMKLYMSIGNQIGDFMKRVEISETLKLSEKRFRALIENSSDAIMVLSTKGDILYASSSAEKIFGHSVSELTESNIITFCTADDQSVIIDLINSTVMNGDKSRTSLYRIVQKNGSVRWMESISTNLINEQNIRGIVINTRDVTDWKISEEKILQLNDTLELRVQERTSELKNANKELETFSYYISHDLRSPLRAIDGFSLELVKKYSDRIDAEGLQHLQIIRDKAKKMGMMIDDLLAFSRISRQDFQTETVDLNSIVRGIIDEIRRSKEHEQAVIMMDELLPALGNSSLLHQVFVNLIENALKFSRKQSHPLVSIGSKRGIDQHTFFVKDNGVGFDPANASKLFGVFQRLHHEKYFEGTGVGLAIVQRIVHRHHGKIWAESEPGAGTTFYFTLPFPQ